MEKTKPETVKNINLGVLGHVDSGKTSLVKAISTRLSTASLDKHPYSQKHGITIDLGFSAFFTEVPERLRKVPGMEGISKLNFTLVDCPGHAKLIKTIIGGAQIIDMMILVVDAVQGIQTQTAECIVIGQILTEDLIVVINKIDLLGPAGPARDKRLEALKERLRKAFAGTRFRNPKMVAVAAAVGGEKVAAVADVKRAEKGKDGAAGGTKGKAKNSGSALAEEVATTSGGGPLASIGMEKLTSMLMDSVFIPDRSAVAEPFYMAVDHAFLVKGHGTVMTGTILKGEVSVNDTVEIPSLRTSKKVKSIQMFREPVQKARKGDRVGICVAGMESGGKGKLERGVLAAPGTIPPMYAALARVSKVRFFKRKCKSLSRVHITVGHATVMATVLFFGAKELASEKKGDEGPGSGAVAAAAASVAAAAGAAAGAAAARGSQQAIVHATRTFPWQNEFVYQETMLGKKGGAINGQWAFLQFDSPVFCAADSTLIGSRLDLEEPGACRIAFHGKVDTALGPSDVLGIAAVNDGANTFSAGDTSKTQAKGSDGTRGNQGGTGINHPVREKLRIYKTKERIGRVVRVAAGGGSGSVEIIGDKLFEKGSDMSKFVGMNLLIRGGDGDGASGTLDGPFGSSGKFKATFPAGTIVRARDVLVLPFKVYIFDKSKRMVTKEGKEFGGR